MYFCIGKWHKWHKNFYNNFAFIQDSAYFPYKVGAGNHFYGTEYELWADFGPVGNTEKKSFGTIMIMIPFYRMEAYTPGISFFEKTYLDDFE